MVCAYFNMYFKFIYILNHFNTARMNKNGIEYKYTYIHTYIHVRMYICIFLQRWKQATVLPLYKGKGLHSDPANYRPVSLMPQLFKVWTCQLQSAWFCHQKICCL